LEAYAKVVELNPDDAEAWLDYSSLLYELNKYDEAIEVINEAIKCNPDEASLYYRMTAYLFVSGKYTMALNYLEIALNTEPEKHHILFEYLPQLQGNHVILDIIKKYTAHN
ncbi:MAG: tetratricopeptide repeat protein, partial [Sphingobacterium sp.]